MADGLRVIRRRTEYVYTSVDRTPFSVAIASPSSFGRYYIDLPSKKEREYEHKLEHLVHNNFETLIQIYNCTYNYSRLIEKLLQPKQYMDFCIRYLFHDPDQVLAIKSDLVFHDIYYKQYNFSMHLEYANLVKSSFYGTYSGITFFMPVTFYRSHQGLTVAQLLHHNYSFKSDTAPANTWSQAPEPTAPSKTSHTEPQTEMTMNVQLGYIIEPLFKTSTKSATTNTANFTNSSGVYRDSVNLLSTDTNKHTYSFEKQFYTRSIEFSDYLRTEFRMAEPMVNYFLNESSREVRRDTIGATLSIWLDKVPTAVTGVMYDAHLFQYFLFENYMRPGCDHVTCRNLCSLKRAMNLSCYLVDEHGIVVLSTQERVSRQIKEPIGLPLYKVNPWLMKILEFEGIYDLVIPGKQLSECRQESRIFNSSTRLKNTIIFAFNFVLKLVSQIWVMLLFKSGAKPVSSQLNPTLSLADHIRIFNNEWRGKNSHCYNFGVYSFNLTKWNSLDASELRVWCNSTNGTQRKFLVGPVKHSNLIMLVVEEEFELIHCGNLSQLINNYQPQDPLLSNFTNQSSIENGTYSVGDVAYSNATNLGLRSEFTINRYRNKPEQCHNYFENEKEYLPCFNRAKLYRSNAPIQMVCLYIYFFKV
ncbi:hypothetical protein BpHYR1_031945 [Brachionus plicatilis]|uniref:Voltage-dependent calcium channel alpha-2/delta subunit conserved region domain-containing protein n=1 Tax=Brachionus plicatilis TaxID=10195 RepID=A0A3M7T772_BRAPC|nr:hypothetical protein BpHYR1_031945 [Brachionus plicatilis]